MGRSALKPVGQHLLSSWQVQRSPLWFRTRDGGGNARTAGGTVPALKGLTAFSGVQQAHVHVKQGLRCVNTTSKSVQTDTVLTKYKRAEGYELEGLPEGGGDMRKTPGAGCGRRGAGRRAGPPALEQGNQGHVFINNVGEDDRRRPPACGRHTREGPEDGIRVETTSVVGTGGG